MFLYNKDVKMQLLCIVCCWHTLHWRSDQSCSTEHQGSWQPNGACRRELRSIPNQYRRTMESTRIIQIGYLMCCRNYVVVTTEKCIYITTKCARNINRLYFGVRCVEMNTYSLVLLQRLQAHALHVGWVLSVCF